jgi:hypothetical protein
MVSVPPDTRCLCALDPERPRHSSMIYATPSNPGATAVGGVAAGGAAVGGALRRDVTVEVARVGCRMGAGQPRALA